MKPPILVAFQKALAAHRKREGLTLEAAARRMGLHRQNLHRMETGPHPPNLLKADAAARAYGKTLAEFLSCEESES